MFPVCLGRREAPLSDPGVPRGVALLLRGPRSWAGTGLTAHLLQGEANEVWG